MQRFQQMQASDIDIYRNELRKTKNEIVSVFCCPLIMYSLLRMPSVRQSLLALALISMNSTQVHLLAKHISKSDDEIERAIARPTYFNPYEAVDFGIIDKVSSLKYAALCVALLCSISFRGAAMLCMCAVTLLRLGQLLKHIYEVPFL
jgi:hypothetical protein